MNRPHLGQRFRLKKKFVSARPFPNIPKGTEGWVTKVWKTKTGSWVFNWKCDGHKERKEFTAHGIAPYGSVYGHFPVSIIFDWIYGDADATEGDWYTAANKKRDAIFRHMFGVDNE